MVKQMTGAQVMAMAEDVPALEAMKPGGKPYDVAIIGSVGTNPGFKLVNNPEIPNQADEYERAFKVLKALKVDVPLGSHPSMYNLDQKYPRIGKGPNPFIDPAGYKQEIEIAEAMFRAVLAEQRKAAGQD